MSNNLNKRKYDILVFGATGFTGKFVLEELIRTQQYPDDSALLENNKDFRLAIAGRNLAKLQDLVSAFKKKYPDYSQNIDCLEADVSDFEKVSQATKQASVVISCVGPFSLYGEPIVKACVLNSTHYVDITGEPRFVEEMFCKYNDEARQKDVMIVHYCGFDSVPADMGSLLVKKELISKGLRPLSIEMFVNFASKGSQNAINFTTYESAIIAMTSKKSSNKVFKSRLAKPVTYGPDLEFTAFPRSKKHIEGYFTTFPAADALVVKMGQQISETYPEDNERYYGKEFCKDTIPSAKIGSYYVFKELKSAAFAIIAGLIVFCVANFSWGKKFLLQYPHWITFGIIQPSNSGGPELEHIENGSFSVKFIGKGAKPEKIDQNKNTKSIEPDLELKATFSGPDAGYQFTSKSVVMAGLTVLKEKVIDKRTLPRGVLTPSVAFGNTSFLDRLKQSDEQIKFEISQ